MPKIIPEWYYPGMARELTGEELEFVDFSFWCRRKEEEIGITVRRASLVNGLGRSVSDPLQCPCDEGESNLIELSVDHKGFGILAVCFACTCGHTVNRVERV